MAAPTASGGLDPDMALSSGAPAAHELALDSVLQQGEPSGLATLQPLQFGGQQ
jgi:hypothetical protein